MSIPVFHDDQHGTAIIVLAALLNSLKKLHKKIENIKLVIAGAGSAGYGIFKILKETGCQNIVVTDSQGAIYKNRSEGLNNPYKKEIAENTNTSKMTGSLLEVIKGSDVIIGVSGKGDLLNKKMVNSMNVDSIIFAIRNPDLEILPSHALERGARIVATGRSDFPNQVNNAIVFPSVFRALLDLRINALSQVMLREIAQAIANTVDNKHLDYDYIIPKLNDPRNIQIITNNVKKVIRKHIENTF